MQAHEYGPGSEVSAAIDSGHRVCGGAPERLERRVRLESLGEVFCALRTDAVVPESTSAGAFRVLAAIDSGKSGVCGALECLEDRVRLEEVCHDLCALHPELVATETASEASKGAGRMQAREYGTGSEVSAAADSGESRVWRRT